MKGQVLKKCCYIRFSKPTFRGKILVATVGVVKIPIEPHGRNGLEVKNEPILPVHDPSLDPLFEDDEFRSHTRGLVSSPPDINCLMKAEDPGRGWCRSVYESISVGSHRLL